MSLSDCARKYIRALSAPWDTAALGACIPTFPVLDSAKRAPFFTGSCTFGGSGGDTYGLIGFCPTTVSDAPFALYNNNSGDFTDPSLPYQFDSGSVVTSVNGFYINSEVTCADCIAPTAEGKANSINRMISSYLKIQCTSPALVRGGHYMVYYSSSHDNVNALSPNQLGLYRSVQPIPITDKPIYIVAGGVMDEELEYPFGDQSTTKAQLQNVFPFANQADLAPNLSGLSYSFECNVTPGALVAMVYIVLPNPTVDALSFIVSGGMLAESRGSLHTANYTQSHADPQAFQAINAAFQRQNHNATVSTTSRENSLLDSVEKTFNMFSRVPTQVWSAAADAGMRLLNRGVGGLALTNA